VKQILITGYIGYNNAGDEGIARVITGHLRERIPEVEITMLSSNPPETAYAYGVRAIGWRDPVAIAEAVRHTDLTILGGGGLFQDYWGFDPTTILTRDHWGLSFYLSPALLSAIYAKPVMLYAIGAGPLLSEYGRQYTKVAGDIASRIAVRDEGSKDLFISLGVNPAKITVTGDPAFDLTPAPDAAALDEVREWKSDGPAVAVCLRTWNFGADSTFSDREIARALDEFLDREGGRLLFVAFEGGDDVYCANRVAGQLRHKDRATVLTRWCSPETIAGILSNASLVLGMRLHSVIFSLAAQVPVVALEYDPKVGALAELVGIRDFTLPFGGLDAHALSERMRQALRESPRLRELGGKATAEMRVRARQTADIAAGLLNQAPATIDYGPDTRDLIGRLVAAQINLTEAMIKRVEACAEALGQPTVGIRPLAMADAVVAKVKNLVGQALP